MRDIDADQLTDKMCSTGLLTDHKQTVISSGCTVHHRNWLLLEYVRQLDLESLLKFCKLLQEEWPEIGTQLIMSTYVSTIIVYIKTHDSESRGQEEAGRTRRTSVIYTGSTGVKFVNALNKPLAIA